MGKASPWPPVFLVCFALGCITVLAGMGKATDSLLQIIASCVIPTASIMLYGARLDDRIDGVKEQVNTNLGKIIDKIPEGH